MDQTKPDATVTAPLVRGRFVAVLLAVAIGMLAWAWYDTRGRIGATQEELARRLRDIETESREARLLARQAQEAARDAQAKASLLENRLAESQSQMVSLEALYQELSRNRDESALAEVEQVLTLAAQQLQLSGNVRGALLALQLSEARLGRSERPQFIALRKALARDIERLKALPAPPPAPGGRAGALRGFRFRCRAAAARVPPALRRCGRACRTGPTPACRWQPRATPRRTARAREAR